MMKTLWLCNRPLTGGDAGKTNGSWQDGLAQTLADSGEVELGIIATGDGSGFARQDHGRVRQWLVPSHARIARDALPSTALVHAIKTACDQFAPDLIHVWGTEYYWGLLTARGVLKVPALLEMQGLKAPIARVFYGGLSLAERWRCIGIKEVLKLRTMGRDRRDFASWGVREQEMIRGHHFIGVQSSWTASHVLDINPSARIFKAHRVLRAEFDNVQPWQGRERPVIFCTAAYPSPFKGLHVAVRALAILHRRHSEVCLRIAGPHQRSGIRQEGYMRWLNAQIEGFGLHTRVQWLGSLSAVQLVAELKVAAVALVPTFVESYCVAMVEAMRVGTPTVAAFTGGTSHLGRDGETCLFFLPGDAAMCAYQMERVLTDSVLALKLSEQAREVATLRNDRTELCKQQIATYGQVLADAGAA